jgi:hypothetical protein
MRILNGKGGTRTNEEYPKNLKTRMKNSGLWRQIAILQKGTVSVK